MFVINENYLLEMVTFLIGDRFTSNETSQNPDDTVVGNQNFLCLSLSPVLNISPLDRIGPIFSFHLSSQMTSQHLCIQDHLMLKIIYGQMQTRRNQVQLSITN